MPWLLLRVPLSAVCMSDPTFRIGCQSWGYDDWITPVGGQTVFYPRGTKRPDMLRLYSRVFDTIEVDATLYGIPAETTLRNWYDETPPGFIFSLKFPREITHDLMLRGPSARITAEFVDRASVLAEKLGLFLIQFPASFEASEDNVTALARYLKHLPPAFRYAVEFRHEAWFVGRTFEMLETAGVALCLVEGKWVDREKVFEASRRGHPDFRYIRIMGERDLPRFDRVYRNRDDVLDRWARQIRQLSADEIFIYADNYFEGFAPATVNKLRTRLGLPPRDPSLLDDQGSLF